MGERLADGLFRTNDFACTCDFDPGACDDRPGAGAAACLDEVHATAPEAAQRALECYASALARQADCFDAVNRCDPEALSVCERIDMSTCPFDAISGAEDVALRACLDV